MSCTLCMKVLSLLLVAFPEPSASVKPVFNMKRGVMWYIDRARFAIGLFNFPLLGLKWLNSEKHGDIIPPCSPAKTSLRKQTYFPPVALRRRYFSAAQSNRRKIRLFSQAKQKRANFKIVKLNISSSLAEVWSRTFSLSDQWRLFTGWNQIRSKLLATTPRKSIVYRSHHPLKHGFVFKFSGKTGKRYRMFWVSRYVHRSPNSTVSSHVLLPLSQAAGKKAQI